MERCDICGKEDDCYIRGINYCAKCYKEYNIFYKDIIPFLLIFILFLLIIILF